MSHTTSGARSAWAMGGTVFAATAMIVIGVFQILMGISAIVQDQFLVLRGGYVYSIDTTAWGWIHLGLGVVVVLAGAALFTTATWSRVVGIILLSLSAIANFLFIPYYPIWSLLIIGLDIFAIWAIANVNRSTATGTAPAPAMAAAGAGYPGAEQGQRWAATNPAAGYGAMDPEAARRSPDISTPMPAPGSQERLHESQNQMTHATAGARQPGATNPGGMPNAPGGGMGGGMPTAPGGGMPGVPNTMQGDGTPPPMPENPPR